MLIETIHNSDTGMIYNTKDFLSSKREEELFKLRKDIVGRIKVGSPIITCKVCGKALRLRGGMHGNEKQPLHFSHSYVKDEERCPLTKERKNYYKPKGQIEAEKFKGQQESEDHINIKANLCRLMKLDDRTEFVYQEKRVKHKQVPDLYKRPDVYCKWDGKEIVFEVQLSTTFLHVIQERETFYRENGIFLIWVFRDFSPDLYTSKDIYFTNRTNLFVMKSKEDQFKCYYKNYVRKGDTISSSWTNKNCFLDDLNFPETNYKPYLYDSTAIFDKLLDLH